MVLGHARRLLTTDYLITVLVYILVSNIYSFFIQWRTIQTALLPIYDLEWGHFERAKMTVNILPASWYLKYLFKGFRSFNTVNMKSIGQRAVKLLAFKVGGLKKKSADWHWPYLNQEARVRHRMDLNHSQKLMDSNCAGLWPTDHIFTALKDLSLYQKSKD